jgi:YebC/PmpR family DNA-binding regulatory protein
MSGHSKWKTIQHKKGAADAKRGKVFSRVVKEIMVAARKGGDPTTNASLRNAMQAAKAANMPMDNVMRAIKKGTGEIEGAQLEEVVYEGFAAGGVGLIVMVLTDNKNRAAAEVRHVFNRNNSNFAAQGAVSRGFQRRGQILVDATKIAEDKLMEIALEAGADDMTSDGGEYEILTDPASYDAVVEALRAKNVEIRESAIAMVPLSYVPVNDAAVAKSVMKFIEDLEDNDDVQNVYANCDIDEAVLKKMDE